MDQRKYETVVVFDHTTGEAQVKSDAKKLEAIFTNNGAQAMTVDLWGRKEAPQQQGTMLDGYYVCYKYAGVSPTLVSNVEGLLRITEGILTFQTHRIRERSRKFKGNPKHLQRATESSTEEFTESQEAEY